MQSSDFHIKEEEEEEDEQKYSSQKKGRPVKRAFEKQSWLSSSNDEDTADTKRARFDSVTPDLKPYTFLVQAGPSSSEKRGRLSSSDDEDKADRKHPRLDSVTPDLKPYALSANSGAIYNMVQACPSSSEKRGRLSSSDDEDKADRKCPRFDSDLKPYTLSANSGAISNVVQAGPSSSEKRGRLSSSDDEDNADTKRPRFRGVMPDSKPYTSSASSGAIYSMVQAGPSSSEKRGQLSSSDDDSPDVKRPQFNNLTTVLNAYVKDDPSSANSGATYADVAQKLMRKMGHQEGKGLGKHGQGIVAPVEASKQKGRRGLGHLIKGFTPSDAGWDFDREEVTIKEKVEWLPSCEMPPPTIEELRGWMAEGDKKLTIEDEVNFCSAETLDGILNSKSVFDNLEAEEMRKARTRSNPYETIRGVFFQNRAAMKMANMDSVLDFMFTEPKDENNQPLVKSNELLYFADICAGPGGFSEYVLWRKQWHSKGFGFTLKGPNDFKLQDFFSAPSELFEPHYGKGGLDGDGDIYNPENLQEFQKFVLDHTDGHGVHFVMADGGFSVDGQENIQEILSKRLYLCQFLCALMILRPGGNFVCKLFDLFTKFSVGLVYLLYRAFNRVAIFKPVTSRPANSERYVVCQNRRSDSLSIQQYLFNLNLRMCDIYPQVKTSNVDITDVVPFDIIADDEEFLRYIHNSNEELGQQQMISLVKIKTFAQNIQLYDHRQASIRDQCLREWKIPDQLRTAPDKSEKPMDKFSRLTKESVTEYCIESTLLTLSNLGDKVRSIYDYRCIVSGGKKHYILFSLGRSHIFRWDAQGPGKWQKMDDLKLEIPHDTVLEVEVVEELRGEGRGQRRVMALHVLDAAFLCGTDVRDLHFNERIEKAKKFVKAITRATRCDLAPIRVKEPIRFEQIETIFQNLQMKLIKGGGHVPKQCYCCHEDGTQSRYMVPVGLYLVRTVSEPWMMAMSRSQNRKYYFHTLEKTSSFTIPTDSIANLRQCLKTRLFWRWDETVRLTNEQKVTASADSLSLSKEHLVKFINEKLQH